MSTQHPFFGADPDSYNIELDSDDFHYEEASDGSGRPGISIVSNALQFWVGQQPEPPTLAIAAATFRMPVEAVAEAVEFCPWMLLEGDASGPFDQLTIAMDGA